MDKEAITEYAHQTPSKSKKLFEKKTVKYPTK